MPEILPDLSEVESMLFDPGVAFPCEIRAATPTIAKTGTQMLVLDLVVNVNGTERKHTTNVMTSGKGAFRFGALLRAARFSDVADRLSKGEKVPFNTDDLENQHLQVVFKTGEYNGEPKNEVDKFLKA